MVRIPPRFPLLSQFAAADKDRSNESGRGGPVERVDNFARFYVFSFRLSAWPIAGWVSRASRRSCFPRFHFLSCLIHVEYIARSFIKITCFLPCLASSVVTPGMSGLSLLVGCA